MNFDELYNKYTEQQTKQYTVLMPDGSSYITADINDAITYALDIENDIYDPWDNGVEIPEDGVLDNRCTDSNYYKEIKNYTDAVTFVNQVLDVSEMPLVAEACLELARIGKGDE